MQSGAQYHFMASFICGCPVQGERGRVYVCVGGGGQNDNERTPLPCVQDRHLPRLASRQLLHDDCLGGSVPDTVVGERVEEEGCRPTHEGKYH